MKLETFFEKFDQLADAPDAVAKMRELVLRLAMSAKLVEQNSNESDGSKVFNAIQQARAKHLNSKKTSFVAATDWETAGDDCELPNSWHRCAISEVCDLKTGATPSTTEPRNFGGNARWLLSGDINRGEIFDSEGRITELGIANSNCKLIPKDSVLIALNGQGKTRATVALLRIEAALNQSLVAMIPYSRMHLIPEFLFWNLRSRYRAIRDITGHEQRRGLNMKLVVMLSLPLPPIEEQKRIVARVEGLMALCDRLEGQQMERETRYVSLARAAVARFDEAPTPADLNFLFHPSYSVTPADLRKIILNLAVQGKLVLQDPDSEPARLILEQITQQKKSLLAAKQFRQGKVSRPQSAHAAPVQLPLGWSWVNVDSLCFKVTDGTHFTPRYVDYGVRFVSAKDITGGSLTFDRCKFISQEEHDKLYRRCNPEYHDIVISKSGSIGAVALVEDREEFSLFESLALLKFDQESLHPPYLMCALTHACSTLTAGHIRGVGVKHLHLDILRGLEFALPPLGEQRRIVARVDQLTGFVGRLEMQLAASEKTAKELLDAVVHELLHPTADEIEFPRGSFDHASQRAAIGCYAIEHLKRNPSFGHTMNMKVVYMAQAYIGLPLDLNFERQAAGPWHPWIEEFDAMGQSDGWFTVTQKSIGDGHTKYVYVPKAALKQKVAEAAAVLGEHRAEFDRLLGFFADMKTMEAEIIATLFAAWNDFLIDGKTPTDDEVIREVRENWHQSKERFTPALLQRWLDWMRSHDPTPMGRGPRTRQQLTLRLN